MNTEGRQFTVMVPQADAMGAIAAIRSLGEHGYRVIAASNNPEALGLKSSFTAKAILSPAYDEGYIDWLRGLIQAEKIDAIVHSEGFLVAIREAFDEFKHLMCLPQAEADAYLSMSKTETFALFLNSDDPQLKANIPPTAVISPMQPANWSEISTWPLPLFVKGDATYANDGESSVVKRLLTVDEAKQCVEELSKGFSELLIQGCVKGAKATVNVVIENNQILAESMVLATHHNPHTGGLTALRHSWWHEEMYQDALLRLKALRWQGAAMVEYAWDQSTQTFNFIELNARYWAALNVDILAGLHFPAIQMDSFLKGKRPDMPLRLTKKICARHTFPADYGYLLSLAKDKQVGVGKKAFALVEFFWLMLHPGIKADLLYPGDRKLYWINLGAFLRRSWNDIKRKFV